MDDIVKFLGLILFIVIVLVIFWKIKDTEVEWR
jgi:hypothetical protein